MNSSNDSKSLEILSQVSVSESTVKIGDKVVTRVYRGKDGKCCCGCSGKYSECPKKIAQIVGLIVAHATEKTFMSDSGYVAASHNGKIFIAYFD